MQTMKLMWTIGMLIIMAKAEELKFFLMPVSCWNNLLSGNITMDCVVRTGVQAINILNMTVVFYYRMPQIMKIVNNKSTIGISSSSIIMELLSLLCVIGYFYTQNYSIWNYGEHYANFAQMVIIYCLVYRYGGIKPIYFFGSLVFIFGFFTAIMMRMLPIYLVAVFMTLSTVLYVSSKFVQILEIHRTHYSKNLSLITLLISPAGVFSRLITSIATLWHDKFLIGSMSLQFAVAFYLFLVAAKYRNNPKPKTA
jgi:mannose-P-dolichol utilization defect protein 1